MYTGLKVIVKLFLMHQKKQQNEGVLVRPSCQVRNSGPNKLLFCGFHRKKNIVLVKLLDRDSLDC